MQENHDFEKRFMKDLIQQFNISSYKLLEKAIRSENFQDSDLKSIEESQIKAFEDQCAEINTNNPDLFAEAVNDLQFWMGHSRARILAQQEERKGKYKAKLTKFLKSSRSEIDIIKSSDKIIQDIFEEEKNMTNEQSFVNAFKTGIKPELYSFIQVRIISQSTNIVFNLAIRSKNSSFC